MAQEAKITTISINKAEITNILFFIIQYFKINIVDLNCKYTQISTNFEDELQIFVIRYKHSFVKNRFCMIEPRINQEWRTLLNVAFQAQSFIRLKNFLVDERELHSVYPPGNMIFNAFDLTPASRVKVVILGQDPYHGLSQAHGLCFSVPKGVKIPPSLVNIFKEINRDLNLPIPTHGNLEYWAQQGVLLLNATLTVRANEAGSHQKKGWEEFTDKVIELISVNCKGVVFLLWGNYAQAKEQLVDSSKHLVLKSVHPSPLSAHRGFIGCGHFSATNSYLSSLGKEPIDWSI